MTKPMAFIKRHSAATYFALTFVVLMVWVYDRTESLLLAMLVHASWSAGTFILGSVAIAGVAFLTYTFAAAAVLWLVVAVVGVASRGQFSRHALPRGVA